MSLFSKKPKDKNSTTTTNSSTSTTGSQKGSTAPKKEQPAAKPKFAKPGSVFRIYALYKADDASHSNPLYFADTPERLQEALYLYDFYNHYPHFKLWCELRDLIPDNGPSWDHYQQTCLSEDDDYGEYMMVEYWYGASDVASLLRMFSNCSPLATSFERPVEVECYGDALESGEIEPTEIDNNMTLVAETLIKYKGADHFLNKQKEKQQRNSSSHSHDDKGHSA